MFCVYTEVYSYFLIKPRHIFSFYPCLRLNSPNYVFMRRRPYSKRKVKEYRAWFTSLVHEYSNKKETSDLSIQLRCCNKNKTKMFIKRQRHKNGNYLILKESYDEKHLKIQSLLIERAKLQFETFHLRN